MPSHPLAPAVLAALVAVRAAGSFSGMPEVQGAGLLDGLSDSLWTYVLLGLSAIVLEELSPIFAGIAAHEGELHAARAIVALTVGGWLATTLLYAMGRAKWEYIRRRWPSTRAAGTVALRRVARNPVTASLLVRFLLGLRLLLPIACGAARVPLAIYLPASLLGSAAWSALFVAIGWSAGEAAVTMIGRLDRAAEIVGAILVTALVLFVLRWHRQRAERKAEKRKRRRVTDV